MRGISKSVLGVVIAVVLIAIGLFVSSPERSREPRSIGSDVSVTQDSTLRKDDDSIVAAVFPDTAAPKPGEVDSLRQRSGLIIPVAGITPDQLIDTYTAARSQGRTHNAIDIMANKGTPVLAAIGGPVKRLFNSDKGGITLYQLGPDSLTVFYYAHLDRYAVGIMEGKWLKQGEVIGYVGDTGNAAPGNYHLHFAVWKITDPKNFWTGEDLNPYLLLRH